MEKEPVEGSQGPLSEFRRLYNEALLETPDYLREFIFSYRGGFPLLQDGTVPITDKMITEKRIKPGMSA